MKRRFWLTLVFVGLGVCLASSSWGADAIKIGFDIESLRVVFPAACGVKCLCERICPQES